ncbi:cilia- and flagella-associated protein 337-like isoform 3-T5 [Anomaloglossus baeobatrachus]|uniref:cilia- and flagella-associated protein 337-like isoform X3 n=1 Tax=Anomaloglossus baeobatrachus TaxID=238106 RepID=UPI003F4FE3FB
MEEHMPLQRHVQKQDNHRESFHLPAIVTESNPHREPFIQISPMPDNTVLAVGQDGVVSVWTPNLKLKKSRCILEEQKQPNRKVKWISDSTLMPQYNKLIVGTCDREIRLYELSNFEPYCQIVGLETMPLHLGYSLRDADECIIYFGDEQGCINIIIVTYVAETLRNWTKCEIVDEIPSIAIEHITEFKHVKYIRWKVHNDWVTQIRYFQSIESIISSSNDDYSALIIGCIEGTKDLQKQLKDLMESGSMKSKRSVLSGNVPPKRSMSDESLFRVKRGVKTFDFSKEANILVTGGLDRVVRVWNPYVPSWPTGLLRGHSSPITYLRIGDENTKIYSVSTNCSVMVWDIENHTCLIHVISKASQIRGDIAACYFSHHLRALYIATDYLSVLQLQEAGILHGPPSVSHSEPVTSCLYNQLSQKIISCSEGSELRTWDLMTGQLLGEVQAAHGHSAITCIALDAVGNRLASGGKDGSLKLWDYTSNSVTPIRTLMQGSAADLREGLTDVTYAEYNTDQYIVSVSYSGQIRIFPDTVISEHALPQVTWSNNMINEHKKNRLCLTSASNMVALSSCNGDVFVWSLEAGEPLCHLNPSNGEVDTEIGNLAINKAVFICSRIDRKKDSAVLITSGPKGYITFWNIVGGGKVFARFEGSQYKCMVNAMAVSEDDSLLCAADQLFYIYIWNISQYALGTSEEQPPVLLHCWRAHMSDITRVIPVEKHKVIVTSSQDCTVKLWTIQGELIGTFGQNKPWDLSRSESKKEESRITKQPSQDVCGCSRAAEEEKKDEDKVPEEEVYSIPIYDTDIADEIKERISMNSKNSIKMVNPKHMEIQQATGRLNAYKSLQICDLMSVSANIQKPNPAAELNDPYDLAF